ncbi:MAG: PhnD/SsuA/transferrin family substrate-binding protein [Candidatus Poseidoniales archaeon]
MPAIRVVFVLLMLHFSLLSGCLSDDDEAVIKIAFSVRDDYTDFDENPQKLADYLTESIGVKVEIYPITSDALALEALRFGSADMAFLDGGSGWMGWKQYGLEVMGADKNSDGRTFYNAQAWVLNDSVAAQAMFDDDPNTDPFSELSGLPSCHTGWLKSAGMLIPMGFFIANNYTEVVGDANDIESLRNTIFHFFSEDAIIPDSGTPYYNYGGALRCLSEGVGQVAFVKDSSVETYCGSSNVEENEDWCLDMARYVALPAFGQAPSHPLMYNPSTVDDSIRNAVVSALVDLENSEDGQSILRDILNTQGIVETTTEEHLGSYSSLIEHVPGISEYLSAQYTS